MDVRHISVPARREAATALPVARRALGLAFLRRYWFVYALVLPAVAYRLFWSAWPLAQTLYLSLTDTNLAFRTSAFSGLENYATLMGDAQFWNSVTLTLGYTAGTVSGELVLGMMLALLLNEKLIGRQLGRTTLLVPWAISAVLAGIIWKILFWDVGGPINDLLLRLGAIDQRLAWLAEPRLAWTAVLVASVWKYTPFAALMLLAGLQTISQELFEAARVDGAGALARFRYITLPLIMPVVLVVLIFRVMDALRAFDFIYGLTQGGPGSATQVLSYYAYQNMFFFAKGGYGATLAVAMLVVTILTSGTLAVFLYRRASVRE